MQELLLGHVERNPMIAAHPGPSRGCHQVTGAGAERLRKLRLWFVFGFGPCDCSYIPEDRGDGVPSWASLQEGGHPEEWSAEETRDPLSLIH